MTARRSFDVVLSGGHVIDGTGADGFAADLGIQGDRIAAIGDLTSASADQVVDVRNRVIAPGFIDVHTHSDFAPFLPDTELELRLGSLRQGVTTEICGNCGFSAFPTSSEYATGVDQHLQALFGQTACGHSSLTDFASSVAERPLVTNLMFLVGHGTVRAGQMGLDDRAPTNDELRAMIRALAQAFEEGAAGFSSGLIYPPGVYANTDELVELSGVAARYGRPYVTHMRDEMNHVQASIDESLEIGRASGAAVQISHHKTAGKANWGRTAETLASLERARDEGIDVMTDVYPYTAGSTMLRALMPPWANDGGVSRLLGRLKRRDIRARVRDDFEHGLPRWQNLVEAAGWENVVIASASRHPHYEGKPIADLADAAGVDAVEFVCDLLVAEAGEGMVVVHMMAEADVRNVLASPLAMIGSDGIPLPGKPHPRWAGSFARVLETYVARDDLLTLPAAIRKMTSMSAARFAVRDRGVLEPSNIADIVVFDSATIAEGATFEAPLRPPTGVDHVLVAGKFAIFNGAYTGEANGTVLRV